MQYLNSIERPNRPGVLDFLNLSWGEICVHKIVYIN